MAAKKIAFDMEAREAIRRGVTLVNLRRMKVLQDIVKMKFNVPNDDLSLIDKLTARLERSLDQLETLYSENQ